MKLDPAIYLCFQSLGSQRSGIQSGISLLRSAIGSFSSRQSRILAGRRPSLIQGQNPLCFHPKAAPAKQKVWALSGPTSGKETAYQNGREAFACLLASPTAQRERRTHFTHWMAPEQSKRRGISIMVKGGKAGATDVSCKCWGQWPQALSFPPVCLFCGSASITPVSSMGATWVSGKRSFNSFIFPLLFGHFFP